ncbi:sporulation protein YqfC [Thermoanaerobacter mathranii subsp. mathranii str. A3]|uniref:Sporulation protein YqfC n=1 Tax=Thermoanaerobacter mathranii subsp. mathranii (strain DSM 11426 / CCUG 53645 / CIP 108742 / A3) TaxID=583358 RepID=A0ABN3Z5Z0_THEM3|nr:sporulation protein YqfC [Thermoanaerobacter mathranii]ADH60693.1 sporulation protein YqfC [Thermoanaerobacter mathranii subsp. mathranii str. A3]
MRDGIKNELVNAIDFPKEVLLNLPKVTLIGKNHVTIENHKGIIEYIPERIRVNTTIGVVRILGKKMIVNSIMTEVITISGEITNIEILV